MRSTSGIQIVLGAGVFGDPSDPLATINTPEQAQAFFDLFRKYGGDEIDTARGYSPNAPGTSEPLIGQTDVASWARIATKVFSRPGDHTTAGIKESVEGSLEALKVSNVYIDYLHAPDPDTPLEETHAAIDAAYRAGQIQHFGLSNYNPDQVRELLKLSKDKGYVKPTYYQGQYNAICRLPEEELLPLLRENGVRFYAWSPAAGGAFSKTSKRMKSDDPVSKLLQQVYAKPEVVTALAKIHEHAEAAGITGHEIALRWILHHSALKADQGDAIIAGASRLEQLDSTLKMCQGEPLPQNIVDLIKEIGDLVKDANTGYLPGQ